MTREVRSWLGMPTHRTRMLLPVVLPGRIRRIPVASRCTEQVFDGFQQELTVNSVGYGVALVWGDPLPDDAGGLWPIVQLLEKYARVHELI
jgi:hypothetical protein